MFGTESARLRRMKMRTELCFNAIRRQSKPHQPFRILRVHIFIKHWRVHRNWMTEYTHSTLFRYARHASSAPSLLVCLPNSHSIELKIWKSNETQSVFVELWLTVIVLWVVVEWKQFLFFVRSEFFVRCPIAFVAILIGISLANH